MSQGRLTPEVAPIGRTAPCARLGHRGFTLVELVLIVVLMGSLAVVALPRMGGAMSLRGEGWRQQVLASLREAHSLAQAHRRLVCVAIEAQAVRLTIASKAGSVDCDQPWLGPDRDARLAHEDAAPATAIAPAGLLYFQPSGRITSDGAGSKAVTATVSIAGEASVGLIGETGHVE